MATRTSAHFREPRLPHEVGPHQPKDALEARAASGRKCTSTVPGVYTQGLFHPRGYHKEMMVFIAQRRKWDSEGLGD